MALGEVGKHRLFIASEVGAGIVGLAAVAGTLTALELTTGVISKTASNLFGSLNFPNVAMQGITWGSVGTAGLVAGGLAVSPFVVKQVHSYNKPEAKSDRLEKEVKALEKALSDCTEAKLPTQDSAFQTAKDKAKTSVEAARTAFDAIDLDISSTNTKKVLSNAITATQVAVKTAQTDVKALVALSKPPVVVK